MADVTILIVDDDRTMVRLCQSLLERAGYQVVSAMNPIDALKIIMEQKIDLLLSDIRMPVMDGFEMVTRARQVQPEMPVLVMTGYGSIENALQALHRGVDGLILKPFENTAELVQTVQRVLGESQQKRDAARLQALRPLFDVTERLLTETSPQTLEILILNAVTSLLQSGFAGIYQADPQGDLLKTVRVIDNQLDPKESPSNLDISLSERLIKDAIAAGVPAILNANRPGSNGPGQKNLNQMGWETVLVAPVRQSSRQFVLCAGRVTGSLPFTEADLEMFAILARQAAVAMENARLYSELKDNVRKIEESQRALIQAEKMAAVGRLVASMAHEINNPLQSVRNCLHLAARKGMDSSQRMRYLKMTDGELERLVTTVRRMLDFYRTGGTDNEATDINQVVDQVLALLESQMREQVILVHVQSSGAVVPVFVVRGQIQQVIFNLLLNAMDAIEAAQADRLSVRQAGISAASPAKEIWIDIFYEARQVRVLVEDTGIGIADEVREIVFEPFVSTKPHGNGLGLAVSYGIMERHHGGLTITPAFHNGGACFEMTLPVGIES